VELFLNLLWFSVSLLLIVLWTREVRQGHTRLAWSTFVALALLLVLLFPVISMTDDLVTMAAPFEDDHSVRRGTIALLHPDQVAATSVDTVAFAALLLLGVAFLATRLSRLVPSSYSKTQLTGFSRSLAVRPPPQALFAA
jgi:hypothetical protein